MNEEKSLTLSKNSTVFAKFTATLLKMVNPTKVGFSNLFIFFKRKSVIKLYEDCVKSQNDEYETNENIQNKYNKAYSNYLETIDNYVMESIYKKVKSNLATEFEKQALADYYSVIQLKDNEYTEYKYAKQQYLLNLDYESIVEQGKPSLLQKFSPFYIEKMDGLYKGILKHFSIKLSDNLSYQEKNLVYEKIFNTIEKYIQEILPLKIENKGSKEFENILEDYKEFGNFEVGKLDQNEIIEKRKVLLSISRKLFTHSLPLVAAEKCYIKLLKDTRNLIVDTKVSKKQERAYANLINLIEDFNVKLLSSKIYWNKPDDREVYKKFWAEFQEIEGLKNTNSVEYTKQKQILFLKSDLKEVYKNETRYYKIIEFYKSKLVELGAMKRLKLAKYDEPVSFTAERNVLQNVR